jgi:hypothetical protein
VTRGAASENRPVAPANNVGALFNVQALISPLPYTPALSTAPSDWMISVNYYPSGENINNPANVAVDAGGGF